MFGVYGAILMCAYPRVPCTTLGGYHRYIGAALFSVCLASFYYVCTVPAGTITEETHERFSQYERCGERSNFVCSFGWR